MARTHGRCARGERLRMAVSHGIRKTTMLLAGLRLDGMIAPMGLHGPINHRPAGECGHSPRGGDWFEAYVAQVLLPTLRPGDVVIIPLDDASHRLPGNGTTSPAISEPPCRL